MLIRKRKSRIYFLRQFFDYPIRLSADTLKKLGLARTVKIGVSYTQSSLSQTKPERTLEQFLINRFGRELYLTFFKSYTEKVWGVPCDQISAEWGAQRIKGLSVISAIRHFMKTAFAEICLQWRHLAEGHGNVFDREVYVPEARAGATLGVCCGRH